MSPPPVSRGKYHAPWLYQSHLDGAFAKQRVAVLLLTVAEKTQRLSTVQVHLELLHSSNHIIIIITVNIIGCDVTANAMHITIRRFTALGTGCVHLPAEQWRRSVVK